MLIAVMLPVTELGEEEEQEGGLCVRGCVVGVQKE